MFNLNQPPGTLRACPGLYRDCIFTSSVKTAALWPWGWLSL